MKLSLVIPTFNESENLPKLLEQVTNSLSGKDYEIIIVDDDSPDKTWQLAEKLSENYKNLKVIRRCGERGLSSAVLEGFKQAEGEILAVMDADLSHPPEVIPQMYNAFTDQTDLVVASRYIKDGGVEDWPTHRFLISKAATFFARPLTSCHDPMSGCFMVSRDCIEGVVLNPVGFKILLEILVKARFSHLVEVPFVFRNRFRGDSKLGSRVFLDFLGQLYTLYLYKLGLR
jgi:dolichol-phosphate mannosyltransferase